MSSSQLSQRLTIPTVAILITETMLLNAAMTMPRILSMNQIVAQMDVQVDVQVDVQMTVLCATFSVCSRHKALLFRHPA
tara:strand:- start:83 stop:319 length:237 start_codon:yes stop_codon:yes gene_type:complete